MRHRLVMEQWVPYPVSEVFDFFADPANLPPLMPGWQRARIERMALVAPESPPANRLRPTRAAAATGTTMEISFRPVPLVPMRARWNARILDFVWDDHFCDGQDSGPFGYWRHCHRIRAETRGGRDGSVVVDDVTYAFPFGILGDLTWLLGGGLQVRAIFRHRQRALAGLLGSR